MAALVSTLLVFGGNAAVAEVVVCEDATLQGCWTAPFSEGGKYDTAPPQTPEQAGELPTAVSAVVTPKGRVVYWDGLTGLENSQGPLAIDAGDSAKLDKSRVLDLTGDTPLWITPQNETGGSDENMFCADQRLLASGRVIVAGGTHFETEAYADLPDEQMPDEAGPDGLAELYGSKHTRYFSDSRGEGALWEFDPAAERNMKYARWYPTLVTQPDGNLLVASGVSKLLWNSNTLPGDAGARASGPAPENVRQTETYDRISGTWSENVGGDQTLPLYARLHLLPNGRIFYPADGQMWSPAGESVDEMEWNSYRSYDPATKTWSEIGMAPLGARSGAFSTLLRLEPNAEGAYDQAQLLLGGGTIGVSPSTYVGTAISEKITLKNTDDDADWEASTERTGDMENRRWYSSGVLLPNGEVLAFSGADKDEVIAPGTESPVRMAEIFNPATGEWSELSAAGRDRTYHNSATLLPDGSVLIGGHAPINQLYGDKGNGMNDDAGVFANNLRDPSFERYYPPYLYKGERPVIHSNAAASYGGTVNVTHDGGADIAELVLTRLPSVTHTTDADARSVKVNFTQSGSGTYQAAVPGPNVTPPGYYYVFALSAEGVPSVASIIKIDYEVTAVEAASIAKPVALGTQPIRSADMPAKGTKPAATNAKVAPAVIADAPAATVLGEAARAASRGGTKDTSSGAWIALAIAGLIGTAVRVRLIARSDG